MILFFLLLSDLPGLTDQNGAAHSLTRGEYTLLDFAASWCGPCHKALPHIDALKKEYPNLKVLVVCVDLEERNWRELVKKHKLDVPVIWDKDQVWVNHFQPPGMPTTLLLDPQGQKVYEHTGFSEKDLQRLKEKLKSLIN